jgi:hypothetical protein
MEIIIAPKWDNFKGVPDYSMGHSAFLYWFVSYTYDYIITNNNIISVNVETTHEIEDRSWVLPHQKDNMKLLRHEQFHYFIAVLCCAEFKVRATYKYDWTIENLSNEVDELFNIVFDEYILFEKEYDKVTLHGVCKVKQLEWESLILDRLEYLGVIIIF